MCRPFGKLMVQPLRGKGQRLEVSEDAGFNQHTTNTTGEAPWAPHNGFVVRREVKGIAA
jgi:hypothetical protein